MYILCKAKQGRQTKNFEFRSLWDRSMAGPWGESRSDETANFCMSDTAHEETKYWKVFNDFGTF